MKGMSHKKTLHRVNRIEGQVRGIATMIESEKYCIEILTQTKAIRSALKSVELEILESHIKGCVKEAILSESNKNSESKIDEMMLLLKKMNKS